MCTTDASGNIITCPNQCYHYQNALNAQAGQYQQAAQNAYNQHLGNPQGGPYGGGFFGSALGQGAWRTATWGIQGGQLQYQAEEAVGISPWSITARIAAYKEGKIAYLHILCYLELVMWEQKLDNLTYVEYVNDIKEFEKKKD